MKQFLLAYLLYLYLPLNAQINLVPNPSFEEYKNCPSGFPSIKSSQIEYPFVSDWFSPINTTPDYFNACALGFQDLDIPDNFAGYQPSRTGNAYCGLIGLTYIRDRREYISCNLLTPLTLGSIYKVSWFVSLGSNQLDTRAIYNLGCYFSDTITIVDSSLFHLKPQIENSVNQFLIDTVNWVKVSAFYKAVGNERVITIGNFYNDEETPSQVVMGNSVYFQSYYYIDDVSVIPIEHTITDTILCTGNNITVSIRPDFHSCIWNDGDTSSSRILDHEGKYWITSVTGTVSVADTFVVRILDTKTIFHDTAVCGIVPIILTAGKAQEYFWNVGMKTQDITVQQDGWYWVRKSVEGCTGIDSFLVIRNPIPIIRSLKDTTVCFDQVAQILLDAGQFKSYLWKPTGETTRTVYSTSAQVYLLSVTDSNNCSTRKQVAVMETCPDFVFVPNAFTPNGDGLNDVFLPQTRNLNYYQMSVLNRWGEIVFTTKNPKQGWDGKDAPADVYMVLINYKVDGKEQQSLNTNVSLLR